MHPRLGWPGPLGIERSIAQQLDPRVVGRITLGPRLQRVAVEVEAVLSKRRHDVLQRLAGVIAIHRIAEAFDLVCAVAMETSGRNQSIRGELDVVTDARN